LKEPCWQVPNAHFRLCWRPILCDMVFWML
jgi:hypothetical protein